MVAFSVLLTVSPPQAGSKLDPDVPLLLSAYIPANTHITNAHTHRHAYIQSHTHTHTHKQAGIHTGRHTHTHTTDRHTHTHTQTDTRAHREAPHAADIIH